MTPALGYFMSAIVQVPYPHDLWMNGTCARTVPLPAGTFLRCVLGSSDVNNGG